MLKKLIHLIFLFFILIGVEKLTAQAVGTYTTSGSVTIPCGVTSITVQCWGGGGGGGGQGNAASNGGAGGGSGGYSMAVLTVTPGSTISYTVGAGGTAGTGNGTAGGTTTFSTVTAGGGGGGAATGGAAGTGGSGSTSTGTSGSVGGATTGGNGGTAPSGGAGGAGGSGPGVNGSAGTAPGGGGGGGGDRSGGSSSGGAGGKGQIKVTFGAGSGCEPCGAIPISSGTFSYTGTTVGGTNYMTGGCGGNYAPTSGNGADMFFVYTATTNNTYLTLQLTGLNITGVLMELTTINATSCGSGYSCLTNGAWEGGLQNYDLNTSSYMDHTDCRTVWFQNAGTYYIKIDSNTGGEGPFTLTANSYTPSTGTAGDACTNQQTLSSGVPLTINNTNCTYTSGTDDPTGSQICAGTLEDTQWSAFTASGSGGNITFSVTGVSCDPGYYTAGPPAGLYSASGQFGILTSSTNDCGGTYSTAVACQSLSTGATYSGTLTNTAGTNYYFVWDGNGGAECQYTITATNIIPLPIQLLSFEATKERGLVDLNWKTASEANCKSFILERSIDGALTFSELGLVKAVGNSSSINQYNYSDTGPYERGLVYYRLKQMDNDGNVTISSMRLVDYTINGGNKFNVYPNPSKNGNVTISDLSSDKSEIQVIIEDSKGQIVYKQDYLIFNSEVTIEPNLSSGIYLVKVRSGNEGMVKKLIVME